MHDIKPHGMLIPLTSSLLLVLTLSYPICSDEEEYKRKPSIEDLYFQEQAEQ